jgi:FkbM family methyltransferase
MKNQMLPLILKKKYEGIREKRFLNKQKMWKQIANFKGCKFFAGPDNKLESSLLLPGENYDRNNFTAIEEIIKEGDICFDIGANIGIYSVVLSKLSGNAGNVHSFEPVNHIRQRLKANCKLNGFQDININNIALGAENSTVDMFQIKQGMFRGGTSTFVENDNVESLGKDKFDVCKVNVVQLDEYVKEQNLSKIDFMKIDVESFEWQVLQGGQKTIREFSPTILMEYDPARHAEKGDENQFKEFFEKNDYQVYEFNVFGSNLILIPFDFDHMPIQRNILCFSSKLK